MAEHALTKREARGSFARWAAALIALVLPVLWLAEVRPLAIPGMFLLWRRARAEAALVLAVAVVQISIFAPYRSWDASNYGHRFLLTVVALGAIPAAVLLSRLTGERRDG